MFLLDRDGRVVLCTDTTHEGRSEADTPYFREGMKGDLHAPLYYSSMSNRKSVVDIHPIKDDQGKTIALVVGRARMQALNKIMAGWIGLGETGDTFLVASDYALLTPLRLTPPDASGEPLQIYIRTDATKAVIENQSNGWVAYLDYRNVPVIGVYHWVPQLQAGLVAQQDQVEAFRSTFALVGINTFITALVFLFVAFAALYLSKIITTPIANLAATAAQIGAGNLDLDARVERADEIGELAQAFNRMTARLREVIANLERSVAELRRTHQERERLLTRVAAERQIAEQAAARTRQRASELDAVFAAMTDGVIVLDTQGNVLRANPSAFTTFGMDPASESVNAPSQTYSIYYPNGRRVEPADVPTTRVLGGETINHESFIIRLAQNRELAIEISAAPLVVDGKMWGAVLVGHDITERKESERLVRATLEESRQLAAEVTALLEATRAVLIHHEFKDAARPIFESCKQVIGAQSGFVALLNEEATENQLVYLDTGGYPSSVDPMLPMPLCGLCAQVARTGIAAYDNSMTAGQWEEIIPRANAEPGTRLFAPLIAEGKVLGFLGLANKPGGFTENDARMATAFGEIAAIALVNCRAADALQRAHAELEMRVQKRTWELEEANQELRTEITERVRAEELVRRHAARTEALVHTAARLNAQLDLGTILRVICEETARALGVQAVTVDLFDEKTDALGVAAALGLPAEFRERAQPTPRARYEQAASRAGLSVVPDVRTLADEINAALCAELNLRTRVSARLQSEGKLVGALNVFTIGAPRAFSEDELALLQGLADQAALAITNARLFEQVRAGRERLELLSHKLVQVQETERRHIARELHDEAGQALTSLIVGLRLLESEARRPKAVLARVRELRSTTDGVLENLHRLAMDLRPASLDHLGLEAALRQYIESVADQKNIAIQLEAVGFQEARLTSAVETGLYRILQEGLTNAVRHSQATQVSVLLQRDDDQVTAIVKDNGIGFDHAAASHNGHLGLAGMRERAEMIGGTLKVESVLGVGTTLTVEVPRANPNPDRG